MSKISRLIFALSLSGVTATASLAAQPLYKLSQTIPLGGAMRWDYLHFDPATHRVFISHGDRLDVLDAATGKIVGQVNGLDGSHGIATDDASGLGYADSRAAKTVTIFDLKTLKTVKTIPVLPGADGMAFDPANKQVFIASGDANAVQAIDATTHAPDATIALGGAPEFLGADGAGSLYVDINDKNELVKIDTKTDKIIARWALASCDGPTGLAIDPVTRRVFVSCDNAVMVVVSADSGKVIASLPIGRGSDAAAFDPRRERVFSSNRDGTLTVIQETGPDRFKVTGTVRTEPGARTMTVDTLSGRIFLVTATVQSKGPPRHQGGPASLTFAPGSVRALILDPTRVTNSAARSNAAD